MTEVFTREQFEAALPAHCRWCKNPPQLHLLDRCPPRYEVKDEGHSYEAVKLWRSLGLIAGEYSYLVPVRHPFAIMIRSSVHADGQSAPSGEDSIRCWIVNTEHKNKPWGSKISRWVTRVPGWRKRLLDTLRELYKMALSIERCPTCGAYMKIYKVKKDSPNKGRIFLKCTTEVACSNASLKFLEVA